MSDPLPDDPLKVTIDLTRQVEVLYMIRLAMSRMLREESDSETDPRFKRKLRELAARFEAGQ